jgi:hypothetical protein
MPIVDSLLKELDQEAATTRKVLERVPRKVSILEAPREIDVAGPAGIARSDHARRGCQNCAQKTPLKPRNSLNRRRQALRN